MRTMIRFLKYIRNFAALITVLLAISPLETPGTFAQAGSAAISGRVTDQSNAAMPDVEVEIKNVDTGISQVTKTNGDGIYSLSALPPGHYLMNIRKQQFRTVSVTGITLNVQDNLSRNFVLQVGSSAESVTVEAGALVMNTTDASVSTVIDRNFVANIPLNGRSFQDLISLTPGVVTGSPQTYPGLGSNGDFSVNGQRTETNSYIVDGISANTNPGNGYGFTQAGTSGSLSAATALGTTQSLISVDALQEFRVESSTYSAEYGGTPGGQFSFVTRSGANSFHGSLYDYLRNNALDANDWFNNYYGIAQPALRQNDFGGTIGGPVSIPRVYDGKDKTFFFLSYEGLRLTQPTEATPGIYVPSNSLRASAPTALQPILNAFSKPTGPEIQIACDNITFQCPTGQPVGVLVPSGLAPFVEAYSLPSKIDSVSLRLDHNFGSRIHTFFRAAYTPSSIDTRYVSELSEIISSQQSYTLGVDTQFSNTVNDQLRVGYTRSIVKNPSVLDSFGGATPVNLGQALGNEASFAALSSFSLQFNGVGGASLAAGNTANYGNQWNLQDNVSWAAGRHLLKVGVDYRRVLSPFVAANPYLSPSYESPTSVLTNSADYTVIERNLAAQPLYKNFALFGQDEWRVTPTLSLSFGLRWEVDPSPSSSNAIKPYPLLGNPNDPATYALGTPGAPLYHTTWNNFAPRLGVAWQIRNSHGRETVLRTGFGVFYDTGTSGTGQIFQSLGTTSYTQPTGVSLPIDPALLDLSFAVTPPYQDTFFGVARNLQLPFTFQWNAALQQSIGSKQTVTLTYVGANGRRLIKQQDIEGGSLNPDFTQAYVYQNGLTSNYQALQAQFQRQMSHGFQALASYTWSHSLDYGSEDANYGYKRGNSDFDVRDNFNAGVTWDLPLSQGNLFFRSLLNGWGVDARILARTAFPVTLNGSGFHDPATGSWQYAGLDIVPGQSFYIYSPTLPGGRQINPQAFASAPPDTLGNAPRNFIRGFGEVQLNSAIRRDFPIRENVKLQFRAEAFNVLNHPNFGFVDPYLSDATFGQATNTLATALGTVSPLYQQGGARSIQFALKLLF